MFGLSTLSIQLLAGAALAAIAFGGGFALESHLRTGDEAKVALAQRSASEKETARQVNIAFAEARAGQDAVNKIGQSLQTQQTKIITRTITLTKEVDHFIPAIIDTRTVIPCGFVRLFDAAASGSPDPAALPLCAGQPDGADSGVRLSEIAAVSAANDGACYDNAARLAAFQQWAVNVTDWYSDLAAKLQGVKP